jgi:hypothetical protein
MYTSVDFTSQIAGQRGVPCPTNKGVSYTNLVWFGRDLKNRLLLLTPLFLSDEGGRTTTCIVITPPGSSPTGTLDSASVLLFSKIFPALISFKSLTVFLKFTKD